MKHLAALILILSLALTATASNVTGILSSPNTSLPVRNATLSFVLSQSAVLAGTFALSTTPVNCYTSVDGAVKGLPNPLAAPVAVANYASGSVPAGTYYVRVVYYLTVSGPTTTVTLPSPATAVVLSGTGRIMVTAPVVQPANATGWRVYVGTSSGSEKVQVITAGWGSATVASYNSAAAAAPSTNDSVCSLAFNDSTIPVTTYRVNATEATGRQVPGFPQQWYLAGGTFDISNGYPLASLGQTRFPSPIIANPSSNALQSVNSPLTVNGYDMKAGALVATGISSHSLSATGTAVLWYDTTDSKLYASVNGGAAVDLLTLTPSLPLAQTNGGTGHSSAITAGEVVYSDGTSYQGTSALTWNAIKGHLATTGRYIVRAAVQTVPVTDTGSLQLFYNTSSDIATIISTSNDGAGGGTGKQLSLIGSTLQFETGTPAAHSAVFGVTSVGPKWFTSNVDEDAMEMQATLLKVPTGYNEAQFTWVKVVLSDGTTGVMPVWTATSP